MRIDKADWAMYLAKRSGRDQVMTFAAQHGSDTPERATSVSQGYVSAMEDLVAAREAYERQRTSAIAHLALEVGGELGLDAAEVRRCCRRCRRYDPGRRAQPGGEDDVAVRPPIRRSRPARPHRPR